VVIPGLPFELDFIDGVAIATAFAFGVELALFGSIKLAMAERLKIDEAKVGGILSMLNLALIPLMVLSGVILDFAGMRWVVVGGSVLTAVGIIMLAWAPTFRFSLWAILLAGFAGASLTVASTKLAPLVWFGGKDPEAASNLASTFFGMGAFLTPLAAALFLRIFGYRAGVTLLALVFALPAVFTLLAPAEQWNQIVTKAKVDEIGNLAVVGRDPVFWMTGLALFFYVPLEFIIGAWATTHLTQRGFSERRATVFLSVFWLAMMASRLGTIFLLEIFRRNGMTHGPGVLVIVAAMVSALLLAMMATSSDRNRAAISLVLCGVSFGPIFPTVVGMLLGHLQDKNLNEFIGSAYGAAFAVGLIGGTLITPLVGVVARRYFLQRGLGVAVVVAVLLAAVASMLAFVV
jgi:fucose permease